MLYVKKRFSVPACGPGVTQDEWDAIFNPKEDTNEQPKEEQTDRPVEAS
jgi:hypothetical protein